MEVKHRPEWRIGFNVANPLEKAQIRMARKYIEGGGLVVGAVVIVGTLAINSQLCVFDPLCDTFKITGARTVSYVPGSKFNVTKLMEEYQYANNRRNT
tara:strand:+ start:10313 stop:10606 length:294 start_codon:yes stop_codon:yes gene_type:complete